MIFVYTSWDETFTFTTEFPLRKFTFWIFPIPVKSISF